MEKFVDYLKFREVSALNMGKEMLGGANSLNLDAKSQAAFDAVIEAFELVLGAKTGIVLNWLRTVSSSVPEIKDQVESILSQHDLDSLKEALPAARRAGQKVGRSISKGLGDVDAGNSDVVSMNAADSFSQS